MKKKILSLMILTAVFISVGCSRQISEAPEVFGDSITEPEQVQFFAMDTVMTFTVYGEETTSVLQDSASLIRNLEQKWSVTDPSSEIYQINHNSGEPVTVSSETAEILEYASEMAERTQGALDPTIYPVLTAWGFTTEHNRIPSRQEIDTLLDKVGYSKIQLDGNTVQTQPETQLDLGAVGKGYAGDMVKEYMQEQGIASALLDIGGNIQAVGARPDGTDWRLGIRNPYGEGEIGILEMTDQAVVTSGNYERYFTGDDGREYGHIIDPETGYPADNGLVSVTIIAEEGKYADALSTAMFVKGTEEAEQYWWDHRDFEMILITDNGEVHLTPGAAEKFQLNGSFGNMVLTDIR